MSEQTADQPRKKSRQFIRDPFVFDRICDEEDGSSMVFGVLTMLTLATAIALAFNTGTASIWSQESQNAADAAAYSGALVAANNLNAIAEMNDAMSVVYYSMMRYSIDCITFGVLGNIAQHKQHVMTSGRQIPTKLSYAETFTTAEVNPSPVRVFGMQPNTFLQRYSASTSGHVGKCMKMIDAGEEWIKALAEAERALAKATPKMIEQTIHEVVRDNFSSNGQPGGSLNKDVFVSIFPKMEETLFYGNDNQSLLREDDFGGGLFSRRFAQRYEYRHPLNYDIDFEGGPVPTPNEWYSAIAGKSFPGRGFYQYRVCWNFHDFIHSAKIPTAVIFNGNPKHSSKHDGKRSYSTFKKDSPNGHWHSKHEHTVLAVNNSGLFPIIAPKEAKHYSGHKDALLIFQDPTLEPTEMDPDWSPVLPFIHLAPMSNNEPHHADEVCPTCDAASESGHDYAIIKVYERAAGGNPQSEGGNLDSGPFRVQRKYRELMSQAGSPKQFQPLILNKSIANFGINVAVAVVPQDDKVFIPKLFTAPEHGYIAMASAKVGLIIDLDGDQHKIDLPKSGGSGGQTWLSNVSNIRTDNNNLFLTNGEAEQDSSIGNVNPDIFKDTYFSARLTPLTLDCWGSNSGGSAVPFTTGLRELLLGGNWKTAGSPNGSGSSQISQALEKVLIINNNTKDVIYH